MARKKPPKHDDARWIWQLAPAPGELRIVHAFVKTAERGDGLSSPGALSKWLVLWGLLPAAVELKAVDQSERLRCAGRYGR